LRRSQPYAPAEAHRPASGVRPSATVRLKTPVDCSTRHSAKTGERQYPAVKASNHPPARANYPYFNKLLEAVMSFELLNQRRHFCRGGFGQMLEG
jgi:hypothetical protein